MRYIVVNLGTDTAIAYGPASAGATTPPEIEYPQTTYAVVQMLERGDDIEYLEWNSEAARDELREVAEPGELEWGDYKFITPRDRAIVGRIQIDFKIGDTGGIVRYATVTSNDPIRRR